MQITSAPSPVTPRNLNLTPKAQDTPPSEPPDAPKGNGYGDRFISQFESNSETVSNVLYPFAMCLVGSRLGGMAGGMLLGQLGGMIGGFGGSFVGYRFGQLTADKGPNFIDKVSGNSRVARSALTTAYAAGLGGLTLGMALGGFAPGPIGFGAGVTVAGMAAHAAWKAR